MKSWRDALSRTRHAIMSGLSRLVSASRREDKATVAEWEEALIAADVPPRFAADVLAALGRQRADAPLDARLEGAFVEAMEPARAFAWEPSPEPRVVLIVGVNGSGKTTTAAKLAYMAQQRGLKPLLAATDTFRAAGADQLKIWSERVGCDVVAGAAGADAAAVAFDAVTAAVARKADLVFIDTAGRMHTKIPLMNELQKVRKSIGKALPGAPHETWMVVDATLGSNVVQQAKVFHEAVALTGLVVTKLDGSSKAGCVLAVRKELGIPVLFVGLGEGMDDLAPFDAREFVQAMLGTAPESAARDR